MPASFQAQRHRPRESALRIATEWESQHPLKAQKGIAEKKRSP